MSFKLKIACLSQWITDSPLMSYKPHVFVTVPEGATVGDLYLTLANSNPDHILMTCSDSTNWLELDKEVPKSPTLKLGLIRDPELYKLWVWPYIKDRIGEARIRIRLVHIERLKSRIAEMEEQIQAIKVDPNTVPKGYWDYALGDEIVYVGSKSSQLETGGGAGEDTA